MRFLPKYDLRPVVRAVAFAAVLVSLPACIFIDGTPGSSGGRSSGAAGGGGAGGGDVLPPGLGDYYERYVNTEARALGLTLDILRTWRPEAARGRKGRPRKDKGAA